MLKSNDHKDMLASWSYHNIRDKFAAGVDEHGGEIRRKPVAPHLREELVDALVYLGVKEEQDFIVHGLLEIAAEVVGVCDELALKCIRGAMNVMDTGNVFGIMEVELSGEPNKTRNYTEFHKFFSQKEIYDYILGDLENE